MTGSEARPNRLTVDPMGDLCGSFWCAMVGLVGHCKPKSWSSDIGSTS